MSALPQRTAGLGQEDVVERGGVELQVLDRDPLGVEGLLVLDAPQMVGARRFQPRQVLDQDEIEGALPLPEELAAPTQGTQLLDVRPAPAMGFDVPLVMSQIKLLVMLTIIGGIQSFEAIYILTSGGPGFRSMVPGLWMYLNAFQFQRMGYACAIGVLLFVLILALTILNLRYFKTSEQLQGQAA